MLVWLVAGILLWAGQVGGALYCDPVCPAPCRPRLAPVGSGRLAVNWTAVWPDLLPYCYMEVNITTNGQFSRKKQ